MARRHAIDVFDPDLIRKQTQTEVRAKMAASGQVKVTMSADSPFMKKLYEVAARQEARDRAREDERRRRDPTFRPDALDFEATPARAFDRAVDYYAVLGVDQHASALELKAAYRRLALANHPDKHVGAEPEAAAAAAARFTAVTEAFEILGDHSTRRQYDKARDDRAAADDAGLPDVERDTRPAPDRVDVTVTLEELAEGCVKLARFEKRRVWDYQTRVEKLQPPSTHRVRVRPGELEGATYWIKERAASRAARRRATSSSC